MSFKIDQIQKAIVLLFSEQEKKAEMEMEMEEVWNRKSIKRRRALKEG